MFLFSTVFNLTFLGAFRAGAFCCEHCINFSLLSQEKGTIFYVKGFSWSKYGLQDTRQRSMYDGTVFSLSRPTFFLFSWGQSFGVNFYYGFKTPPLSLSMFLRSLYDTLLWPCKDSPFLLKPSLSVQGKLFVPRPCSLSRCFGVWVLGRSSALRADIVAFYT